MFKFKTQLNEIDRNMGELLDKVNSESQHKALIEKLDENEKYTNHIDAKITQVVSNSKKTLEVVEENS